MKYILAKFFDYSPPTPLTTITTTKLQTILFNILLKGVLNPNFRPFSFELRKN